MRAQQQNHLIDEFISKYFTNSNRLYSNEGFDVITWKRKDSWLKASLSYGPIIETTR